MIVNPGGMEASSKERKQGGGRGREEGWVRKGAHSSAVLPGSQLFLGHYIAISSS